MEQKYLAVGSCRYEHPTLGQVHVKVHGTTRHISARWVGRELCITLPPGVPAEAYDAFLAKVQQELLARRPEPYFMPGTVIDAPLIDITITTKKTGSLTEAHIDINTSAPLRGKRANYTLNINSAMVNEGIETQRVQHWLNRNVIAIAGHASERLILPRAREIADRIGQRPLGWALKETRTRLGSCSSKGIITLSPRLIFLPLELCDYIICHELAHLSEMNHSAAFHELCNRYCGGREAEFKAAVRAFRFPVF